MGSDLTVKNSHNKTVSHPAKQKGAKVAFDFTKPIHMSGRNSDGGNWSYVFSPDRGTLEVCSDTGNYCVVAKDTDKNGKFDTQTVTKFGEDSEIKEELDESNSEYGVQTFARSVLVGLQQQNKEYQPPKVDIKGKIGKFRQQTTGDCDLLAGTLALSYTKGGAKLIKDSILRDQNGDVRVTLKGINKVHGVSPEEIHDEKRKLSTGSDDMRVLEIAFKKEELDSAYNCLRLNERHPGMFDVNDIQKRLEEPIKGYSSRGVFLRLTKGQVDEANSYNWKLKDDPDDPFQPPLWEHVDPSKDSSAAEAKVENDKTRKILDGKMKYPDRFAVTTSIIVSKYGPYSHGVAIKRVDKKNVVYVDPHDSSKEIKVPREQFMNDYAGIRVCDLKTPRSKEEDNFAR